jgi:gamma-glutamyltranspeptidase/glutathione hydrolase
MVGRPRRLAGLLLAMSALGCGADSTPGAPVAFPGQLPATWAFSSQLPVASGRYGVIASDASLATRAGVAVLERGGNAIDAAVATAFVLAVVYPEAGNIGGGGFLVLRTAHGEAAALDFRETAPAAARADMYLDSTGELTDRSITGHLAAGVPGSVAGLWEAHQRYGSRPWAELLAPAVLLAEEGFRVDSRLSATIAEDRARLSRFPASAALFFSGDDLTPPSPGDTWRNPDLATVLRRIAEQGPAGFYEGATADLIVAEMEANGGLITHEDLRSYRANWREPIVFQYRGHTLISMPPPSSGGMTLALIANILEGYDLAALGWNSAQALHVTAEGMRRAFADRNHFLGDPDFVSIPRDQLLSLSYAADRRRSIGATASPSAEVGPGLEVRREGTHTTHFSVVDRDGNVVAFTTTINSLYGSAVTVTGGGFLLNNTMDDFTAKPGAPNMFGLVQGEANAIRPGKRMLSAMTPTVVVAPDGEPLLVTGARGGPRIITAVFQVISNVVDHGMDVAAAVSAPRIHHQHLPDVLYFEPGGLSDEQIAALAALGHTIEERPGYIGAAPTILRRGDVWEGVPDPRLGGLAQAASGR